MFPKDAPLSIHAHILVHLGIREKFHGIHPLGVHTFFFKIHLCSDRWIFPKKNWQLFLFKSMLAFLFLLVILLFLLWFDITAFGYFVISFVIWHYHFWLFCYFHCDLTLLLLVILLFPWHAHNNDDLEIYAKLIMHAPMWTLKHQVLWPCNTKA